MTYPTLQATKDFADSMMIRLGCPVVSLNSVGQLNLDSLGRPKVHTPTPEAVAMSSFPLAHATRRYFENIGGAAAKKFMREKSDKAVASIAMNRTEICRTLGVSHLGNRPANATIALGASSTGDYPSLVADALGKASLVHYAESRRSWRRWAKARSVADFREQKRIRLEDAPPMEELEPGATINFGYLPENPAEVYSVATFARGLRFTRRMILNDDTEALQAGPQLLGQAAARLEEKLAYNILTANGPMADTIALFATGHANISTGVLSVSSLGEALAKLSKRTSSNGETLDLVAGRLLVPTELTVIAGQLIDQAGMSSQIEIVPSGYLSANSAAQWYMLTNPEQMAAVEVAHINGYEQPRIDSKVDFHSEDLLVKCVHDVAAGPVDYRAAIRSSGA